ncbi:MAG: PEP-CTERM sorting domain-containing protein [Akkermansiaceae bacterium]
MKLNSARPPYLLTAFTLSSLIASLSADTITWNGGGNGTSWTDASNWIGGIAPANDTTTDIAQWSGGIELDTDRSVNGLDFTGGAQLTDPGDDNTLTLGGGGIDVTGGGNGDIYTDVVFAGDTTITLSNRRLSFRDTSTHSGSGNVTITGGNIAYFDVAASTRTGGTTVTGGARAVIKGSTGLGSGTVTLDNGTVEDNNTGYNWANDVVVNAGGGTLNFNGNMSGTFTGTGALTIVGSSTAQDKTITADGSGHSGGVTLDNVKFRTANANAYGTGTITLQNGAAIKNNDNSLTFSNNIAIDSSGGQVEVGWGRAITFTGDVSGNGLLTVRNDSGSLRITGNNSYSGGTEIQGFVNARSGGLGTGDILLNDADGTRGQLQNFEQEATFNNNLTVSPNGGRLKAGWNRDLIITGVVSGSGQLTIEPDSGVNVLSNTANTFSGDIVLTGATSRLKVGSLGSGNYAGTISGAGTIEFAGSGTQIIASASTISYTGSTVVDSGNLQANGNMTTTAMFVRNGATISGVGTLGITTIEPGGTIAPGQSPGTISTGSISLQALANYDAEVNGALFDQINVIGTVDVSGANLNLSISGPLTYGDEYILINNDGGDGLTGTFAGLAEGDTAATSSGFNLIASYTGGDGNDFSLTVIPEPSSSFLVLLGAVGLMRRRRS